MTIFAGAETVKVGGPMAAAVATEGGHMDWPDFYQSFVEPRAVDPASVGEAAGADLQIFVAVYGPAGGGGSVTHFVSPTPNWGVGRLGLRPQQRPQPTAIS